MYPLVPPADGSTMRVEGDERIRTAGCVFTTPERKSLHVAGFQPVRLTASSAGRGHCDISWYWATSRLATFGLAFRGDRIVECAPFGRRWLMGRTKDEARAALRRRGYRVVALDASGRGRA